MEKEKFERYNEGKPKYSLIDFTLFSKLIKYLSGDKEVIKCTKDIFLNKIVVAASSIIHNKSNIEKEIYTMQFNAYSLCAWHHPNLVSGFNIQLFESTARVLMYGAEKYAIDNWRKPIKDKNDILDSLLRHVAALQNGELKDKESGELHCGHIMANIMFYTHHFNKKYND